MKFSAIATNLIRQYDRYRTLSVLQSMTIEQLEDIGIAPELLGQGVAGYPWRRTMNQQRPLSAPFRKAIDAREVMFEVNPKEVASNALTQAA